MKHSKLAVAATAMLFALTLTPPLAAQPEPDEPGVGEAIQQALAAEGPYLLPDERALIERKCGYGPGGWDGHSININDGIFHCTNGRRLDDPEVRAMMKIVGARISARVSRAMDTPLVQTAIDRVAERAAAQALESLSERRRPRD